VSGNPLWGVLAIALFSLLGIGILMLPGFVRFLPARHRYAIEAGFRGLYFIALAVWGYFRLVEGHRHEPWGLPVWLALVAVIAVLGIREIKTKLVHPNGSGDAAA
jgi:hypothetical protein